MPKYYYEAKNDTGQLVRGEVQAATEAIAEKVLTRNQLVVTKLESKKTLLSSFSIFNKISVRERAQFARQLATMIDAGLPLVQALNIILLQTKSKPFHKIIETIIRDIESGYTFSGAMAKHPQAFNQIFITIVKAGEATGKLDQVLLELADQSEKDAAFAGKIKGALAYPAFIVAAMIGVGILMMVEVIPTIKGVFDEANAQLPLATRALIGLSDFIIHDWYIIIVAVVLLVGGLRLFLVTTQGKIFIDKLTLKIPVFSSTSISIMMARLTRTLGLLVASGIPILEALRIVSQSINNTVYQKGLEEVRTEVERGVPMSVPLTKNKNFPVIFGQMMAVGEQTGRVDGMLANMAKFYSEESDTRLKSISSLIEPLVMVVLGVAVAVLIFAILVPIYNISSLGG